MIRTFEVNEALAQLAPGVTCILYTGLPTSSLDVEAVALGLDDGMVIPVAIEQDPVPASILRRAEQLHCTPDMAVLLSVKALAVDTVRAVLSAELAALPPAPVTPSKAAAASVAVDPVELLMQEMAKAEASRPLALGH